MPFDRKLTDSSGKQIPAEVIGQVDTTLVYVDRSNNRRSAIPVHRLSLKDRLFMYRVREKEPPSVDYPFERELTDKENRKIQAQVVGKSTSGITVIVKDSNQRFDIPFIKLSTEDRDILKLGRNHSPPPAPSKPVPKLDVPYINRREAEILDLKKKQEILEVQINSGTLNEPLRTNQSDQLISLKKEIKILETAIETYKWRNKISEPGAN